MNIPCPLDYEYIIECCGKIHSLYQESNRQAEYGISYSDFVNDYHSEYNKLKDEWWNSKTNYEKIGYIRVELSKMEEQVYFWSQILKELYAEIQPTSK